MQSGQIESSRRSIPTEEVLALSYATALVVGVLDALAGLLISGRTAIHATDIVLFQSATTLLVFALFHVTWWLFLAPLGRIIKISPRALAIGIGFAAVGAELGVITIRTHLSSAALSDIAWAVFVSIVAFGIGFALDRLSSFGFTTSTSMCHMHLMSAFSSRTRPRV